MRTARVAGTLILFVLLAPRVASAQWEVIGKAALPSVPYWWTVSESAAIDLIPLVWTGDVDGSSSGCCVFGFAGRTRVDRATVWLGLAFGTGPDGGTPAAVEAAAELDRGAAAFRRLNGRWAASLFVPLQLRAPTGDRGVDLISVGVSALSLDDESYVPSVPLFSCPDAPAVPCESLLAPYPWSPGDDVGLAIEATRGRGSWGSPRLRGSLIWGVKVSGGDYGYVRGELDASVAGRVERFDWRTRLAGAVASGGSPLQRRFLLSGADPVRRWLSPYIDGPGALFERISYFVPGGPNLRAYIETQPLVESYLGVNGAIGTGGATQGGFWGRVDAFLEAAWTPGVPDRLGPEELNEDGGLLFDYRELPGGEGAAQGRFLTGTLEPPTLWADAGFALEGGYRRIAAAVSLPLWASQADFADDPIGSGPPKSLALRWSLTVAFYPYGSPGY